MSHHSPIRSTTMSPYPGEVSFLLTYLTPSALLTISYLLFSSHHSCTTFSNNLLPPVILFQSPPFDLRCHPFWSFRLLHLICQSSIILVRWTAQSALLFGRGIHSDIKSTDLGIFQPRYDYSAKTIHYHH